jgi:phosphatidylethanolamine-binding protein (PEBP) family uncharacterized protein
MPLSLTSPAFPSGGRIPVKYTRDGQNVSPPLAWRDAPQQTQSYALVVEDPDVNRAGFLGGILAWIMRLGQAPPSEHSSALRLRPAARCRRARAAGGG